MALTTPRLTAAPLSLQIYSLLKAKEDDEVPRKLTGYASDFTEAANDILFEYEAREGLKLPPYNNREGYLKRESYHLIKTHLERQGGIQIIKNIIAYNGQKPKIRDLWSLNFYLGLVAIDRGQGKINHKNMFKYARQFTYARENDISAIHLVGFIYQIGGDRGVERGRRAGGPEKSLSVGANARALHGPSVGSIGTRGC